jgi:predicted RNA-binding protein with RPS1 domain
MTCGELLALVYGMDDTDQLDFSIKDTQQQSEQSSRNWKTTPSGKPKKQHKRRTIQ